MPDSMVAADAEASEHRGTGRKLAVEATAVD
jgi:hypothetical protein